MCDQAGSPLNIMSYVVWNFPNVTSLYVAKAGFRGSILAPKAEFFFKSGEMEGSLWVKSFRGNGQVLVRRLSNAHALVTVVAVTIAILDHCHEVRRDAAATIWYCRRRCRSTYRSWSASAHRRR